MTEQPPKRRALFLDRDGVVNREVGYLSRVEDVEWTPGFFELCRHARDSGYVLVVVTNQSGIARGYYSEDEFHALMRWMGETFRAEGVELAAYYFCPHHPDSEDPRYRLECECRKPGPGMLLRAAEELGLDLSQSIMVGDRCGDVGAANTAGLLRAYLLAGTEDSRCEGAYLPITTLSEVFL